MNSAFEGSWNRLMHYPRECSPLVRHMPKEDLR